MTERAARSGPAGVASRAGSMLRSAWRRVLHLWRASLGFRVVIVTMLLGILVLTAVGTYLYGSIAQGLVDSRQRDPLRRADAVRRQQLALHRRSDREWQRRGPLHPGRAAPAGRGPARPPAPAGRDHRRGRRPHLGGHRRTEGRAAG